MCPCGGGQPVRSEIRIAQCRLRRQSGAPLTSAARTFHILKYKVLTYIEAMRIVAQYGPPPRGARPLSSSSRFRRRGPQAEPVEQLYAGWRRARPRRQHAGDVVMAPRNRHFERFSALERRRACTRMDDGDMTIGRRCRGTPLSSRASILAPLSTMNSTTSVPAAAAA